MKRLALTLLVVVTPALLAQEAHAKQQARYETQPATTTFLVADTTFRADDSPLVRAAKRTLAARKNSPTRSVFTVKDSTLQRGRVSFATGPVDGPTRPSYAPPPDPLPQPQPDRAAEAAKRIQSLEQEQRRLRDEADEGPYGEVEEDNVERRLSQIPNEIGQAQQENPPSPR